MKQRPNYSYNGLLTYLAGGRNKNDRPTNKHSLRIIRTGGEPAVRMHRTTIAVFHENGTITINAGGWEDSMCTRDKIGEVTGVSLFSVDSHLKRYFSQSTRLYALGLPRGVPYARDCIARSGGIIWHPDMKEQGIEDIRDLQEEVRRVDKDKPAVKEYYAARRSLLKRLRPILHFIDEGVIESTRTANAGYDWLEDVLFSEINEEDAMYVACTLVEKGKPETGYWQKSKFDTKDVPKYLQNGIGKIVGPSSWGFLSHLDLIDTVMMPCREV